MKYFSLIFVLLIVVAALFVSYSEANYCPCDLTQKDLICGTNGNTYKNRCEFECTQREYNRLGRKLNVAKKGKC